MPKKMNRLGSIAKRAFEDLLDQNRPFSKLLVTQLVMVIGDTFITISLAGTLFFSISPHAARSKVILYLFLTMAPFAVISPLLGPFIDKSRSSKKLMVLISGLARAILCLFMASDIKSLLLFPEAFLILVASKLFMVTKSAMIPEVITQDDELASVNARVAFLSAIAGFLGGGLAIGILKLFGSPSVLRVDFFIYLIGFLTGLRLKRLSRDLVEEYKASATHKGLDTETVLGLSAVSVLRGGVGFLTFLLAFGLRTKGVSELWYGYVLAGSTAGSLLGSIAVSRLRTKLSAVQIISFAMILVIVAAGVSAGVGDIAIQGFLTLIVGFSVSVAKPSYDSMVQSRVDERSRGRAFARSETQLQLIWVIGSLLPVVFNLPLVAGDIMLSAVTVIGLSSYVTARRAIS
jgi:MFS family permease